MLIHQLKIEIKQNKLDEFAKSMHSFLPKICNQNGPLEGYIKKTWILNDFELVKKAGLS